MIINKTSNKNKISFFTQDALSQFGCEARGEFEHWQIGIPMHQTGIGFRSSPTQIPTGVFSYKFRSHEGHWFLDNNNHRTRSLNNIKSNVLIINGAAEPLLHAPLSPWIFADTADGRLFIRAGLRKGCGNSLKLAWHNNAEKYIIDMQPIAEEDEHVFFEGVVPNSSPIINYIFILENNRYVGMPGECEQWFTVTTKQVTFSAPTWWQNAIIYTIFVDRFRKKTGWDTNTLNIKENVFAGGDLWGIIEAIPYLVDLGVTVLHLTPIALAKSCHRYDTLNFTQVDDLLGGEAALLLLFEKAHAAGLRILLDMGVTHMHRNAPQFLDVRRNGLTSRFASWFKIKHYPFSEQPGLFPGYEHYQKGQWEEPLLNLDNPEVVEFLSEAFAKWIQLGADAMRLDAAADLPVEVATKITAAAKKVRPDVVIIGEVIPSHIWRWTAHTVDAATDFVSREALVDFFINHKSSHMVTKRLQGRYLERGAPYWSALNFTATHDQHRFLSLCNDKNTANLAHIISILRAGIPALYYGDEIGLSSSGNTSAFEGTWSDRQCMPWNEADWNLTTLKLFKQLLSLRRNNEVFISGEEQFYTPSSLTLKGESDKVLAFQRQNHFDIIDVYVNNHLTDNVELSLISNGPQHCELLFSYGSSLVNNATLILGAKSAAVIKRKISPEAENTLKDINKNNETLAVNGYEQKLTEIINLPTRLYLTVSELCNATCNHCINNIPNLMQTNQARSMQPWLLNALTPLLAATNYFGFSHGGESLVHPMFIEVLKRINNVKKNNINTIHLLTNGMLLTPENSNALLSLGVNSISVSLDGANAATNNYIRTGTKFDIIIANIKYLLSLRPKYDVRVGISCVVNKLNVSEMPILAQLAKSMGVDWLKLEEMFPTNTFAKVNNIKINDNLFVENIEQVKNILSNSPVRLVEHFYPAEIQNSNTKLGQAFREADNFANRTNFSVSRMAWEQVSISPDGSVYLGDYDGICLGNLLINSFWDLWNSTLAQEQRHKVCQNSI